MGIAHVCLDCGTALTRVRPIRDPHYGLALVICPTCRRACVRRPHPIQQAGRRVLQLCKSVGALVLQLTALAALAGGTVGCVNFFEHSLGHESWLLLSLGVLFSLLAGVWLTAGLSHWRRWAAWAAWAGLASCLVTIKPWLDAPGPPVVEVFGLAVIPGEFEFDRWLRRLAILAVLLGVATAGVPFGRIALRLAAMNRVLRWRKRRARIRKWRTAA